jgi:WD repeat-containing protein 21A
MDFGDNPNIVYTGLRNAKVLMTDLRTPTSQAATLCRVPGGKAVIGVKRVDDGAVPFGLVASAMGNEVSRTKAKLILAVDLRYAIR